MSGLRADLRLAWLLARGSDRQEGWRVTLTAVGAALATGFALGAAVLGSLSGQYHIPYAAGLLNQQGTRNGVITALALLLVPVLGFLGQCARMGAVHRDRRIAALRLAGASPRQVRRIAALESGLACLLGSAVTTVFVALLMLTRWTSPPVAAWAGIALVGLAVPVLGAAVSALSLRKVITSPLGRLRRAGPRTGKGVGAVFLGAAAVLTAVVGVAAVTGGVPGGSAGKALVVTALVVAAGAGAVGAAGATARFTGRLLAGRARSAAPLIAGERLREDPWATARAHGAALLVAVVGTAFVGIREVLLGVLHTERVLSPADLAYSTTGIDLAGAAILVALAITVSGLAVGTAESLATRRRELAAQAAAGVPRTVLARTLLLETALPLAPAMVIAATGGMAVSAWYAHLGGQPYPVLPLVVPVVVYAACVLAAATSLPLLRRSLHPAELRHA